MFKKIFYSLTILAMLFGMFGVMGKGGVTPAFAATGWNENATGITTAADLTPLPYTSAAVTVTAQEGPGLCAEAFDAWIYVGAVTNPSNLIVTWDPSAAAAVPIIGTYAVPAVLGNQPVALLTGAAATSCVTVAATAVATFNIPVAANTALYVMIGSNTAASGAASTVTVARNPINDTFATSASNSGLPVHNEISDFTALTAVGADPATTCIADPSADTGWETVTTGPLANFLHVHSETAFDATIAVFNDNFGLGTEIDCQNSGAVNTAGLHNADLVVSVLPNTIYHVYIAPRAFGTDPIAGGDDADLWIGQFIYGGGIIANLCETNQFAANDRCDQSDEPLTGATIQAQLSTGGTIYTNTFDGVPTGLAGYGVWASTSDGDLFVDVPDPAAGTSYTLGISSLVDTGTTPSIDTIWFVPAVASFVALDPDDSLSFFDSLAANHLFLNVGGATFGPTVSVAAAGGVLPNFELPLGTGTTLAAQPFRIIPGGFYDFEAILDPAGAATDYFLISLGVDCLNVLATCPLAFNTSELLVGPWPGAHPHASIDRQRNVAFGYTDFAVGAPGTNFATSEIYDWTTGADIVVSAKGDPLYMDAEVDDVAVGPNLINDQWVLQATAPGPIPAAMAPNTTLTPLVWRLMWDSTLPLPATPLADLFSSLTAPGLLPGVGNEVPWTSAAGNSVTASYTEYRDADDNILIAVSPIDYLRHDYFPVWPYDPTAYHHLTAINRATTNAPYVLAYQILGDVVGAVDPAYEAGTLPLTGLGISRYEIWRCVDAEAAATVSHINAAHCYTLLYAISPTDNRMGGAWSWSWVEGLYELGLTNGTAPGVFSPDQTISRAEMAVFLSRMLSDYSLVPPAPAATGLVFTGDVPATQWAAKYIEQLKAYNITDGCGPTTFCPDGAVTRAEMAKFIEKTFRVVVANGGSAAFTTDLGVVTPGTIFVDVGADHWANWWIDEMALDGLTTGCLTEMSGVSWIHWYCPNGLVTRGQMAKFIVSGFATVGAIQGNWPILAPER